MGPHAIHIHIEIAGRGSLGRETEEPGGMAQVPLNVGDGDTGGGRGRSKWNGAAEASSSAVEVQPEIVGSDGATACSG